ncbi:MAG: hypothetical protein NTY19_26910 [Planctomycetota bacterium]|nr:hypothetical protein [Planctomycetota bacterium]
MLRLQSAVFVSCLVLLPTAMSAAETVGKRPYEMDWAGRTEDIRPALIDFETLDGWTVECHEAEATFTRSREQQLWGQSAGKLTYRGTGKAPRISLKPPRPIPVPHPADCLNFWLYGNNWGWAPDRTTPQVELAILLRNADGQSLRVSLGHVRWQEWWVMHVRLSAAQQVFLKPGTALEAIEITGGRNPDDRVLYFDNLAVYQATLPPLTFAPRPKRGITLFSGQSPGTNTGPGTLPFPTREETILPDNLSADVQVSLEETAGAFLFHYRGSDGHLVARYQPATGTLGDVTVQWEGRSGPFQPMVGGGVRFATQDGAAPRVLEQPKLVRCLRTGDVVEAVWSGVCGQQTVQVVYTLRLWQKSLVIDVKCPGGVVAEVSFGKAVGVDQPRLVTVPYLAGESQRPAVLVMGPADKPCFLMGLIDHCRSHASLLWAVNDVGTEGVVYNGGSRYQPKTDGQRNDCFERLFLTLSPRFEEILPNVPNPRSPWQQVTGERVWRAHGAGDRAADYALWKQVARYGMSQILITDHETGWRDGGESFTLRTRAAPGKGGDQGQADYGRQIHALGFRYGIYNNYTDFAPVNEHWDEDFVTRLSDGQWHPAWPRCYNLKPARAVELEARLAPIIQQKFQLDTAYCDVHTAVTPWAYCDYDARVPGAGTFAATFYAYGEIMLHQKRTWNGPVYSEGNNHWYYCGLTDGNYGQDQAARLAENPWLVDFDLRKLHPLCCNFGMGNLEMFYPGPAGAGTTPAEREARLDRFLAATLAFGHTGFLVLEGGMSNAVRSYFNVQQVHARYAQAQAAEIRYADQQGRLLDTSAAVATGAFRRSQVVTRYDNGLEVMVNGHPTETWQTPHGRLPPNGWHAQDPRGDLLAFSLLVDGHRADYVDSPAYLYVDGRGQFTRFAKAAADGKLIVLNRDDGSREVIPVGRYETLAVSCGDSAATAEAWDAERKSLGPAETRLSRGLVHVLPVPKAFSYVLKPSETRTVNLKCERERVVPGETVTVVGRQSHTFAVPPEAKPNSRIWQQWEGGWIDFTVVPLADAALTVDDCYHLKLTPHLPAATAAQVAFAGQTQTVRLVPGQALPLEFALLRGEQEQVQTVSLEVSAGPLKLTRTWWLKTEAALAPLASLTPRPKTGQCLRKGSETALAGGSGAIVEPRETACGEVTKPCLFMHPPYQTGVGYAYAIYDPVALPKSPAAAFRVSIGKADGSDPGDGILFQIAVVTPDGQQTMVAEKQWLQHAWTPLEADLTPWAGQRIQLKLIADVGPADNSAADWACWAELRIETRQPELQSTLHDTAVQLRHELGPYPLASVSLDELRRARSGRLHYQGIGLECSGRYVSSAALNQVPLGNLPAAGGDERANVWSDASIALTPEAVAALNVENRFTVSNPGQDCFKIRRFWIELELADGRKCSSLVTTGAFTQPAEWLYTEGTGVPFGQQIEAAIPFRIPNR